MSLYNDETYNSELFGGHSIATYGAYYSDVFLYLIVDVSYEADSLILTDDVKLYSAEVDLKVNDNDVTTQKDVLLYVSSDTSHYGEVDVKDTLDIHVKGELHTSKDDNEVIYSADVELLTGAYKEYTAEIFLDKVIEHYADTYLIFDFAPRDWQYYRILSVNAAKVSGGPHVNFPALLILEVGGDNDDNGDLADTFSVIGTTKAEAAKNIAFTDLDDNKYAHEIGYFSNTESKKYIEIYINIPNLSNDTQIKMWYRDNGADDEQRIPQVWSNNYVGVWHLTEQNDGTASGSTLYLDSTAYSNDGQDYVQDTTKAEHIGLAQSFNGNDDKIVCADSVNLRVADGDFTISVWAKSSDVGYVDRGIICKDSGGTSYGWAWIVNNEGYPTLFLDGYIEHKSANTVVDDNQWHHLVVRRSGYDLDFFHNGNSDGNYAEFFIPFDLDDDNNLTLGQYIYGTSIDGSLDEVRIAATSFDDAWVITDYNNQSDNDSFWSVGQEIPVDGVIYDADVDLMDYGDSIYHADVYLKEVRYSFVEALARRILSLNEENVVNIVGFNTEYVEIILNTKSGSDTTIGENATSHSMQIEATVNILDKEDYNDKTASRTAVPDGTKVRFEIVSVSSGDDINAIVNPVVAETKNGKAETSLVVSTPLSVKKVDVLVEAYIDQF